MMPSSNELGLYKRRLYRLTIEGGTFEVIEALIEKSTSLAGEGFTRRHPFVFELKSTDYPNIMCKMLETNPRLALAKNKDGW
eukprot:scaffold567_cov230-Alexandrium_tamarense.AAC.23